MSCLVGVGAGPKAIRSSFRSIPLGSSKGNKEERARERERERERGRGVEGRREGGREGYRKRGFVVCASTFQVLLILQN